MHKKQLNYQVFFLAKIKWIKEDTPEVSQPLYKCKKRTHKQAEQNDVVGKYIWYY